MRTTLTIEPDVARRLERLQKDRDASFKSIVNEALRLGLDALDHPAEPVGEYRTVPWDLGRCRLPDLDDVASALAHAEGELHR
jgi:hypothetical protein